MAVAESQSWWSVIWTPGTLTWPGDLTWHDRKLKLAHKMCYSFLGRFWKFCGAAPSRCSVIVEKQVGRAEFAPPLPGRGLIWYKMIQDTGCYPYTKLYQCIMARNPSVGMLRVFQNHNNEELSQNSVPVDCELDFGFAPPKNGHFRLFTQCWGNAEISPFFIF